MNDIDYDELDRAVSSLTDKTVTPPSPPVEDSSVTVRQNTPPAPSSTTASIQASLTEKRSSGRFMDVMHPSSDMRSPQIPQRPVENNVPAPEVSLQSLTPQSPSPAIPEATGSPFLPDTKVEKRPLGAFADSGAKPNLNMSSDKPAGNETPMPPELQDDLLSLESDEDAVAESEEAIATPKAEEPKEATAVASPQVPGSILQQYTEKADTSAPTPTSIFEVGSIKPAKQKSGKKSGWMVIVWILLLIILGAGAGAAVYFYVLPMIQA